jgi:nucleoside-diphosphate-sugar epimerase
MNILIVGASGATGRLLVEQLLDRGHIAVESKFKLTRDKQAGQA